MEDFEEYLRQKRVEEEKERLAFLDKCANKVKDDSDLIYRLLALGLCSRFNLELNYNGEPPYVVYGILNYFVDNVDMGWDDWLYSDDAPLIRPINELKKVFPELALIYDNEEDIVKLANKLYDLDIKTDYDSIYEYGKYFYANSFNFNSFTPINVSEIKKLKDEKETLIKYGHDVSKIDKKISEFGLTKEEIEAI